MDSDSIRFIREEIRRQLNVILCGVAGNADHESEDIQQLFPGMPTIEKRPTMHPFGLVSVAPEGTLQVNARVGDHVGARIIIGHRDSGRPDYLVKGETVLYNQFGQEIYLQDGSIHIGSQAADNPLVLGTETKAMLQDLITLISTHTHVGNLGAPTSPPQEASQFVDIQANNVDNDLMFSDSNFTEKGG